jgi:hypothetical protein
MQSGALFPLTLTLSLPLRRRVSAASGEREGLRPLGINQYLVNIFQRCQQFTLSLGERAGVRGNETSY